MADESDNVSMDCHQISNLNCQTKNIPVCLSLSKSSSFLPCSTLGSSHPKSEIHKSLNNISTVPRCETSIPSPTQNARGDYSAVESNCNHLSVDKVEDKLQLRNHHLSIDTSLAATGPEIIQNFVRYDVSENISLLGHSERSLYDGEHMELLDTPTMVIQKSYSDYCCGHRNSVPHSIRVQNKSSATYSSLSLSSSISGSGSDRTCNLSTITQDSGIVYSPSNIQNNLTDAISTDTDHNIALCHMNGSTIQHDITVYTMPGTYHGILGSENSGNGLLSNDNVHYQSQYSVMTCDNISKARRSLPPLDSDSCSTHCYKVHDTTIKDDDTIAAYCHPMPIPSFQFSNGQGHLSGEQGLLHTQTQLCPLLTPSDNFAFPKLISSVSESGLDAKKLIRCGKLTFPQISDEESDLNMSVMEKNDLLLKNVDSFQDGLEQPDKGTKMKDNWTMTTMNYLSNDHKSPPSCKDAEVQTAIIMEHKSVSTSPCIQGTRNSHLFPQFGPVLNLQCPQSPMREVRWDDEGRTWEVYGAAMDPEVLGLAIQKHLEIQIEQQIQPSEQLGQMDQSAKEKRRSFRTVIQSLGQSNCCVRTSSASDLHNSC